MRHSTKKLLGASGRFIRAPFRSRASDDKRPAVIKSIAVGKFFAELSGRDLLRVLFRGEIPNEGYQALRDVNFEIPRGQFLGVLGRNGAGKSTLLRTVGKIYGNTSGQIVINGEVSAIYELGVRSNKEMTGRDFTEHWLTLINAPKSVIDTAVTDVFSFSELGEFFDKKIQTYSSGMKARLLFAVATSIQAEVILLDEVLTVGDAYFSSKCLRRIRDRISNGVTGIFATHDWTSLMKVCQQALVLEKGIVQDYGKAQEVVPRYLEIPTPEKTEAWFTENNPKTYRGTSGEPADWTFEVELDTDNQVYLFISVEQLKPGTGWVHYLQGEFLAVGNERGVYRVEAHLPALPLRPGEYSLSVGLSRLKPDTEHDVVTLDARGWTRGNGFDLIVEGGSAIEYAPLRATWDVVS